MRVKVEFIFIAKMEDFREKELKKEVQKLIASIDPNDIPLLDTEAIAFSIKEAQCS